MKKCFGFIDEGIHSGEGCGRVMKKGDLAHDLQKETLKNILF